MQFKVIKDTTNHISAPVSYIKHRNIESFETLRETAEWDKWLKIESELYIFQTFSFIRRKIDFWNHFHFLSRAPELCECHLSFHQYA